MDSATVALAAIALILTVVVFVVYLRKEMGDLRRRVRADRLSGDEKLKYKASIFGLVMSSAVMGFIVALLLARLLHEFGVGWPI